MPEIKIGKSKNTKIKKTYRWEEYEGRGRRNRRHAGSNHVGSRKDNQNDFTRGTIDGNVTLRITGNGQVSYVSGESRGYPSYAVYAYTVGENGKVQTVFERTRRENKIEDLTKTMTVILRFWCYQRIYVFVLKDRFKINTIAIFI